MPPSCWPACPRCTNPDAVLVPISGTHTLPNGLMVTVVFSLWRCTHCGHTVV